MKFISFDNIGKSTIEVAKRFPLCLLFTILVFVLLQYQITLDALSKGNRNPIVERLLIVSYIGSLSFLAMYTWVESWKFSNQKKYLFVGGNLILLLLLFILLPHEKLFSLQWRSTYITVGVIIFLHLFISYIPYLRHDTVKDFWIYNKEILLKFLETTFFAAAIFIGLLLAILALDNLFGMDFDDKVYLRLFILCGGLFHPIYFLSQFPKQYYDFTQDRPSKSYLIFCKYIILPIVGLYFIILYSYAGKIAFTWELPKGWISQLILWFSVVGILAYLLNYYNDLYDDSAHIKWFKKWYFYILFPMMGLVFLALYVRLSDYGFTEPRYILMVLGIWLTIVCLYYIISSRDDIRFIPISLSIMVLISIFGPWGMRSVSIKSQTSQLVKILQKEGVIIHDKYAENTRQVDRQNSTRIINILYYLDHRKMLDVLQEFNNETITISKTSTVSYIRDAFNLDAEAKSRNYQDNYISYYADTPNNVEVKAYYDYMIPFSFSKNSRPKGEYILTIKDNDAILIHNDLEICNVSLQAILKDDFLVKQSNDTVPLEVDFACESVEGKLYFNSITLEAGTNKVHLAEGLAFIRTK